MTAIAPRCIIDRIFDRGREREIEILNERQTLDSPRLRDIRECHRKSAEWDRTSSKISLVALGIFLFLSCLLSPFYLIPTVFCGLYAYERGRIAERREKITADRALLVNLVHSDDEQDLHSAIVWHPATRKYVYGGLILHGWPC